MLAAPSDPFSDADVLVAVVDIDANVREGTVANEARGTGHLFVTVECQDDPGLDQTVYGIRWTTSKAAAATTLSCTRNGELNRVEDTSVSFTASRPVGTVGYQVVRKNPDTQQWEPAERRGPAFQARLTLWITKGTGPAPTS